MSKSTSNEGFKQRFKEFLGIKKAPASHGIAISIHEGPKSDEYTFTNELLQEIGSESQYVNRIRMLKDLCEFLVNRKLEDHAVEAAWLAVEDLLQAHHPLDARHTALQFLTVLISSQYQRLNILRAHFFKVVSLHNVPEDLIPRINCLRSLSENGKDISYFEEEIGIFLLSWIPEVIRYEKLELFMPLLINIIHYNSSYLNESTVAGIIREICQVARNNKETKNIELSLSLLDAVVRYSSLPLSSVNEFISALCTTVNVKNCCQYSWKIMRNVLGTHLGHRGVYTMCTIMESGSQTSPDVMLIRGAVFFIGMCLWGSQRVTTLKHSHSTVLPSMLQGLYCHHGIVCLEVTLSIQRLIKKYGYELHVVSWDSILDITEKLQTQVEQQQNNATLVENFHILLNYIEELIESSTFKGPEERFYDIVEKCASNRPESSLLLLVSFRAQAVHPAQANWIINLQILMEKFFRCEIRTTVRIKALDILSFVLTSYRHWYEEELLDQAVLPFLRNIANDPDVAVRIAVIQLLLDLSQTCDSTKCTDILNIIKNVVSRRVEIPGKGTANHENEDEEVLKDIKAAISGLVQVFKVKLFRLPHCHAQQAFSLLVAHLGAHYYNGYNSNIASVLRNIIFECFLSMRCDTCHRLGFANGSEDQEKFTHYYVCTESAILSSSESKARSLGVIPYSDAFHLILNCLQYEWDWTVLEGVLSSLPSVLQNKTLVLAAEPSLKLMSSVLCKMVSDPATVLDLQKVPRGVGRTGFHALVFPVLTVLATYHFKLARNHQSELVQSLELGFLSKCANLCVSSLTLCTMEMQPVMNSLLPAILVRLSQISATVSMAVPMLEFLSGLVHLPHLYASFKENQYKSVFAICLPYTDSFRYSQYTVTLAYHVITAWFVRARLPYRKDFVGFIAKGLKTNIIKPERLDSRADSPSIGLRSRSSSSSQSTHTATRSASPVIPLQLKETDSVHEFHKEMSEVCMDMMARYSFASCFSQPKRTVAMDFLLSKGLTRRWVVGNTVVSITTSGTYIDIDNTCENCLPLQNRPKPDRNASIDSTLSPARWRERDNVQEDGTLGNKTVEENTGGNANLPERSKTPEPCSTAPESQKTYATDNYEYAVGAGECHCICQGWAEIKIRRPTGNISWVMRIQNRPEGQMAGMLSSEGDITTAVIDDPHIKEYLLVPDGETEALKIRTKSHEVLSVSKDSEILLIDVIKKDDQLKLNVDSKEAELPVAQPKADDLVSTVPYDDSMPSQAEADTLADDLHSPKAIQSLGKFTPINSPTYDSAESENESFSNRPRLLSKSPRRGPSAFRMTHHSESSDIFEHKSPPSDLPASAKRRLQYEKPELGVSPAECDSVLSPSSPDVKTADENTYLTSSEMYQIASNDENPKVSGIGEANSRDDKQHYPDQSQPKEQPVKIRLKSEAKSKCARPKSLELLPSEQDPKINHSPLTHTCSTTSGPVTPHRLKDILQKDHQHPSSATSSPRIPAKTKLTKSFSSSSPRIIRKNRSDVKNTQSLHGIQTSNDQLGQIAFGKVNKSSSSPDLSSPTLAGASKVIGGDINKRDISAKPSITPSKDSSEVAREPQKFVPVSESHRSPLDPNFVFLQLYHTSFYASSQDKPIPLREGEVLERAIKCLDRIPPYDTHKIGVIYVGPEQHNNETAILSNVYGSTRYMKFIAGLGQLIRLNDSPPDEIYTGGLDREGGDGEFAYSWQDSICQVIFHVATLMPTKDSDPGCNSKKMHIGNDFVTIVYNDSEENVAFGTIKGQFNFAELVIKPLDNECNVVTVRFKEELKNLSVDTGPRVISDINLSMLVRQLAIHINMASVLHQSLKRTTDAYGCNWLERLRQIKRLRGKAEIPVPCSPPASLGKTSQLSPTTITHPHLLDFTEYVISDKK